MISFFSVLKFVFDKFRWKKINPTNKSSHSLDSGEFFSIHSPSFPFFFSCLIPFLYNHKALAKYENITENNEKKKV